MKTSECIETAADLLERSRWWRGDEDGSAVDKHCVLTSFFSGGCHTSGPIWVLIQRSLYKAIKELHGYDGGISSWNDKKASSQQEAVDMMRYAAKLARAEEEGQ